MPNLESIETKLDTLLEQQKYRPGNRRYMAVTEAAEYAGISNESIRRLLATKKLTAYRPVPGRVVVDRLELDALIRGSATKREKRSRPHHSEFHRQN